MDRGAAPNPQPCVGLLCVRGDAPGPLQAASASLPCSCPRTSSPESSHRPSQLAAVVSRPGPRLSHAPSFLSPSHLSLSLSLSCAVPGATTAFDAMEPHSTPLPVRSRPARQRQAPPDQPPRQPPGLEPAGVDMDITACNRRRRWSPSPRSGRKSNPGELLIPDPGLPHALLPPRHAPWPPSKHCIAAVLLLRQLQMQGRTSALTPSARPRMGQPPPRPHRCCTAGPATGDEPPEPGRPSERGHLCFFSP